MSICPHCNKEVQEKMVQQGLHLSCYNSLIEVWLVYLLGDPDSGYFENQINDLAETLKSANEEDSYVITRMKMKAGIFFNLPKSQGF